MKIVTLKSDWNRWCMVVIYAAAMAWVESAVVFYLRSMIGRIDPYQPNPLPVSGGFALVELMREFATMVMLFATAFSRDGRGGHASVIPSSHSACGTFFIMYS
jgi:hypothetical protein